jgi:hypothetical protein
MALEPEFRPVHAVGFLPLSVVRSPFNVELVSALMLQQAFSQFLPTSAPWQRRLWEAFTQADEPPVLRTFLSSKTVYVRHLETIQDWHRATVASDFIHEVDTHLPEHFWVTEVSLRDLYSGNRRKLGEMLSDSGIVDPSDPRQWGTSWLALRLPGIGIVRHPKEADARVFDLAMLGHTDLLRLSCPRPTEW